MDPTPRGTKKFRLTSHFGRLNLAACRVLARAVTKVLLRLTKNCGLLRSQIVVPLVWVANRDPDYSWKRISAKPVSVAKTVDGGPMLPESSSISGNPRIIQAQPVIGEENSVKISLIRRDGDFPAIEWREFKGVEVRGERRTGFIHESALVVENSEWPVFSFAEYKHGMSLTRIHNEWALVQSQRGTKQADIVVYVGSFAPDNWYHWLVETLPRVWLLKELPERLQHAPLLIPQTSLQIKSMRSSLDALIDGRRVIPLWAESEIFARRLVWIDGMFSMKHHAVYSSGTIDHSSCFHESGMQAFRNDLMARVRTVKTMHFPKRVFLDRDIRKRPYNRDQILAIAVARDFRAVDPSVLTFAEQVALFNGASTIIGPTGGAWANLLFAGPWATGLYWTPRDFSLGQAWPSLAALSGATVFALPIDQPATDFHSGEYRLPPEDFEAALDQVLSISP